MLTGIILAGGQSRRMGGQPKGRLLVDGEALIARQAKRLRQLCEEVIVIANEPELYSDWVPSDVRIVPDRTSQAGPLGGLEAAWASTESRLLWVVGCDMPHVSAEAARYMTELLESRPELEAAIPSINGRLHPLHGLYKRSIETEVARLVKERQLRMMGLFDHIRWTRVEESCFEEVGIPTDFVTNVNTPEEWEQFLRLEATKGL